MKKIIFIMVITMVAFATNAQNVVNSISTRDAQACGEYLVKNPQDTIVNESNINKDGMRGVVRRSVYLKDNRLIAFNDTTWYRQNIQKVEVTKKKVVVTSQLQNAAGEVKNDTVVWNRQDSKDVSFENDEKFLNGDIRMIDKNHKDLKGDFRHKTQATVLGGGRVVDGNFSPVVTGRLGYETCHFLFELEGNYSFNQKYTEVAQATGSYSSLSVKFRTGWKFWQDRQYRHFAAILVGVGYGYQKTDDGNASARSRNYAFEGDITLRWSYALSRNWRMVLEGGYGLFGKVRHNEDQDLSNMGPFVKAGIGYAF